MTEWKLNTPLPVEALLTLPGVANEQARVSVRRRRDWPHIEDTLLAACGDMAHMRADEGRAMAADLAAELRRGRPANWTEIEARAPLVVDGYRTRLTERLEKTLAEYQITLNASDLIKEVSIFAERSDISEEIVRLRSHMEQFARRC